MGGTARMKTLLRLLVAGCAALAGATAHAQTYPNKPITLIVPFGAGSGTDTISRIVAHYLSIALKQNVVVETRPGANGAIAAAYVARWSPDGYRLLLSTNSALSGARFLTKYLA